MRQELARDIAKAIMRAALGPATGDDWQNWLAEAEAALAVIENSRSKSTERNVGLALENIQLRSELRRSDAALGKAMAGQARLLVALAKISTSPDIELSQIAQEAAQSVNAGHMLSDDGQCLSKPAERSRNDA